MKTKQVSKFILTSLMMVMTLYIYSVLRGTKDALIVSELGAEVISALKLYGVLPCAILSIVIYSKLVDVMTRLQVYHTLNFVFVGFFVIFDFFLYPNAEAIHFDLSDLSLQYPVFKYVFVMLGGWSYSLFYIMSELWGSIMLSLMFWQLANQINTVDEAKKNYPLLGFVAQIGLVGSGALLALFTSPDLGLDNKTSLHYICLSVLAAGIALSAGLYVLSNNIVSKDLINGTAAARKKSKMGLIQSMKYVFSSKYICLIALLILCYGISINLVEGVWKKQLGLLYPDLKEYGYYMGKVQIATGIATFASMLASSYMLRIFSWKVAALATPLIIFATGCPFFLFVVKGDGMGDMFPVMAGSILFYSVLFGAMQNVLSKAVKYSFFDPTKEMAYIPLDEELKSKGKAAAEVIGGRLGKSGGAVVQQVLLSLVAGSTLVSLAPVLFALFLVIMGVWFFAVVALYKEFTNKNKEIVVAKK